MNKWFMGAVRLYLAVAGAILTFFLVLAVAFGDEDEIDYPHYHHYRGSWE